MKLTNAQLVQADSALGAICEMVLPAAAMWKAFAVAEAVSSALRPYQEALRKLLEQHARTGEGGAPLPLLRLDGGLDVANAREPEVLVSKARELLAQHVEIAVEPLRASEFAAASGAAVHFRVLKQAGLFDFDRAPVS